MFNIIIDGRSVQAGEDKTVLQLARELKIDIPTLCYHENLSPFGACRLCTVEVKENDQWKLAAACQLKAMSDMEIRTDSEAIRESRKTAATLLLYRYPNTKVVRDAARKCGVEVSETAKGEGKDCILCGLCTRTCREIVGADALTFMGRGLDRDLDEPKIAFHAETCIGCGSCAFVCPTGFVTMEAVDGKRIIWDKVFHMATCQVCGRYFAPVAQLELISRRTGVPMSSLMTCVSCR
ncbi:MAG: 2Fe-2S iron-sulfur cluster-binding protein [Syntrophales bacterium]|nr:2Fe-2S iron-sulfur cluster-binding protein [Syntrophales bacterium]